MVRWAERPHCNSNFSTVNDCVCCVLCVCECLSIWYTRIRWVFDILMWSICEWMYDIYKSYTSRLISMDWPKYFCVLLFRVIFIENRNLNNVYWQQKKTHSLTREHRGILCTRTYSIQAQIKFWNAVHRMKTIAIHATTLKYIKWNEQIKFNCFRTFNTIEWSKTIDKVKQAHRMAAKFDEHHQMDGFLVKIQCELNNCVCVCYFYS